MCNEIAIFVLAVASATAYQHSRMEQSHCGVDRSGSRLTTRRELPAKPKKRVLTSVMRRPVCSATSPSLLASPALQIIDCTLHLPSSVYKPCKTRPRPLQWLLLGCMVSRSVGVANAHSSTYLFRSCLSCFSQITSDATAFARSKDEQENLI